MRAQLQVGDVKELRENLDRLRIAKAVIRPGSIKAMKPVAVLARSMAPKGTEDLAKRITIGVQAKDEEVGRVAYPLGSAQEGKHSGTRAGLPEHLQQGCRELRHQGRKRIAHSVDDLKKLAAAL